MLEHVCLLKMYEHVCLYPDIVQLNHQFDSICVFLMGGFLCFSEGLLVDVLC